MSKINFRQKNFFYISLFLCLFYSLFLPCFPLYTQYVYYCLLQAGRFISQGKQNDI